MSGFASEDPASPILLVTYGGLGDCVRTFTVARLIQERHPGRPLDIMSRAPWHEIIPFMEGIRGAYGEHTPHGSLGVREKLALAARIRKAGYGRAYILSRNYKAALIPFLAGIPVRIGYFGEGRVLLINRIQPEFQPEDREIVRMCKAVLEPGEALPGALPLPRLTVPFQQLAAWKARENVADEPRPVLVLALGATDPMRRWPVENFIEIARRASRRGWAVWILAGALEAHLAARIAAVVPTPVFQGHTIPDLVMKLAAADVVVANESGPLHVAAALGRPTVGILGPTGFEFTPLNPFVAVEPPRLADGTFLMEEGRRSVRAVAVDQIDAAVVALMKRAAPDGQTLQPPAHTPGA
jgi:heptosyltransferase-2